MTTTANDDSARADLASRLSPIIVITRSHVARRVLRYSLDSFLSYCLLFYRYVADARAIAEDSVAVGDRVFLFLFRELDTAC